MFNRRKFFLAALTTLALLCGALATAPSLADGGAKELHRDDFGVLFAKEIPGDEPLVMVNVVNSTPEANGDFHDYFLRVPPSMRTAREAVAWTFGKTANLYSPTKET